MSDVIQRGIIEVVADASSLSAGMDAAKRSVEQFEAAAVSAAAGAGAAMDRTGSSAGSVADKLDASTRRYIASVEREIAAINLSRSEYRQWEAQVKGISEGVYGPLVQRLSDAKAARDADAAAAQAQAAAEKQAAEAAKQLAAAQRDADQVRANQQQFLSGLREQIALQGRSADEALRYRAAQMGISNAAAPLLTQLQNIKAAQEAAANAARAEAQAQRDAAQAARSRDDFVAALRDQAGAIGKSRTDLLELRAAQLGVTQQAAPFIARLRESERGLANTGMSAAATAAALRNVPAQLTDIVVGLQAGQAPLTVLLQQGGQLRDMFGSVSGAAKALGGVVASVLLNPLVMAAAAVGALAYGYSQGSKEGDNFSRALIMTGNAAGTTVDALNGMAAGISHVIGTQGQAAEALAALAATGRVASGNLEDFATTAVRMQRTTGKAVQDTAREFAALGKDPVNEILRLNDEMNFLTVRVYEQIKALQEAGRTAEAAALAQRTYAEASNRMAGEVAQNLGSIQRGWLAVKDAISEVIDANMRIGRVRGPSEQIAEIEGELKRRESGGRSVMGLLFGTGRFSAQSATSTDSLKEELELLKAGQRESARFAAMEAERTAVQKAGIDAARVIDRIRQSSLTKQQQLNKELVEYRRSVEALARSGNPVSTAQIKQDEANIRERFKERGGERKPRAYQDDAATRMLLQLRQQEQALQSQLTLDDKLGTAARARIEFEQLLADLKDKKTLTAEQKSLSTNRESILAQLKKNEAVEAEVKLMQDRIKAEKEAERERQQFLQRRQQIDDQIERQQQSRRDQYEREFSTLGMGADARKQVEDQRVVYREYDRLMNQLRRATPESLLGTDEYIAAVERIKQARERDLAEQLEANRRKREAEGDWTIGASEAINNYLSDIGKNAQHTEQMLSGMLRGIEDSLTGLFTTGKLEFDSFASGIVAGITRIIVQQQLIAPMAKLLGDGLSGGGGFIGSLVTGLFGGGSAAPSAAATSFANMNFSFTPSGFASGGYTGHGGRSEPAGLVHRGEYVINAASTRALGRGFLDRLNGYEVGGLVGAPPASTPASEAATQRSISVSINQSFAANTDARTAQQAGLAAGRAVERAMARNG